MLRTPCLPCCSVCTGWGQAAEVDRSIWNEYAACVPDAQPLREQLCTLCVAGLVLIAYYGGVWSPQPLAGPPASTVSNGAAGLWAAIAVFLGEAAGMRAYRVL